jgi:two-component system, chemotaxis family, sensor kinase CheA
MSIDDDMRDALKTFTQESLELLQDMEDCLLGLEDDAEPAERINSIFRVAHTIKGSSGLFGLSHIVAFTHVVESVLDALRDGRLTVSSELIAALLPCRDHIALLINGVAEGKTEADEVLAAAGSLLLGQLQSFLNGETNTSNTAITTTEPVQPERLENSGGEEGHGNWHLFLQFGESSLRDGMDPLSFIRYLTVIGEIIDLHTISHTMPDAESMDPENSYLSFEVILKSDADKPTIEAVFDFVRDFSQIHILPLENRIPYYAALIAEHSEESARLGDLLLKSGVITQRELDAALDAQKKQSEELQTPVLIGEIMIEQKVAPEVLVHAALDKQKQIQENKARENQSIRVDADRLDKLIDLVGELVISAAAANLKAQLTGDIGLLEANAAVIGLVEELRDSALQLRMVPIGTTFSRFQRVVRDVSKDLGKDIRLVITGAETEVDKSVVEKIGDPLMHLVRNAMDHGIETAEVRAARGKPAHGTLRLNAYHSSGSIVIEVSDDGGGLDRERIHAKAVERGLIQASDVLNDQEIYSLIFEPGFSTVEQVSNLSGRGVGMDVVKRNITELRGIINIESQPGQVTTLRIHLPLTLAIIDGFLVGVGEASYVIPLDRVVECVELPEGDMHDYMELRGEVLPFIRLRKVFNKKAPEERRQNVIVVEHLGLKAGVVVDRLQGELQTVIKPLGKLFGHIKGVGGSTILGSGEVALIIDVPTLLQQQDAA